MIPAGFAASLAGPGTVEVQYLGTTEALAQGLRAPIDAAVARVAAVATAARRRRGRGRRRPGTRPRAAAAAGYPNVAGREVTVTQVGEPGMFDGLLASSRSARRPSS